ncbi:50S ribosomal protein L13 [Candidatus Woesebacteria bacterium RIFCSPLOWO2_01_FULL_39_61]|uniref:Large ribosomal subunit protein uL13 n=2 Tax=Microgenomates group TaxID=1794810 RepID=A0A0H4TQ87_9BACT|nr:50S ribosomal protein L13, large subunit ribosomal protein L13 [uncultured Microgenomates bacterium Rifle_16ft_4_minimus_37836]OGM28062.1 MAG: 50S ribosomal protein L13 [Candidatus Woesebacteria bacterium RIFCSPHIGHO2_01_FULL_39_95]OGM34050.1 MAG: 50S ribosomal protein L13 [Candidatus Woesebacteria bacterium RIFCSPHIGHO2_02_FULL_39_13]OGM38308.1 MAG: 50S ribosomal protein L13 [Candidatus Woesebacteria bacterium RIFCSPHIGHO2_12_FULL_40_20]OGM67771.1 MAG: 50S ribosomal protein L13 [Candidatus 
MKTYQPKAKDINRNWHLIDAKGKVLGRMSTEIAILLMGKHKATFAKHMDTGDYVVVINAKEVELTGKKPTQKVYRGHSGYPGGFKEVKISKLFERFPGRIIEKAVAGMLPDNRLKKGRMGRLKIFTDDKHPYGDKFKNQK